MNSYYTNRIEGEHTRPSDIERALQQDFFAQADLARKQRLAVAHIRTEAVCEAELDCRRTQGEATDAAARWLYTPEALTWLHAQLFDGLPASDLTLADGSQMVPGQFRQRAVAVGGTKHPPQLLCPRFCPAGPRRMAGHGGVKPPSLRWQRPTTAWPGLTRFWMAMAASHACTPIWCCTRWG